MGDFHFDLFFDQVVILILENELDATVIVIEIGDLMEDVFEVVFFIDVLVSLGFRGFFFSDDAEIGVSFKNILMRNNFRGGFVASINTLIELRGLLKMFIGLSLGDVVVELVLGEAGSSTVVFTAALSLVEGVFAGVGFGAVVAVVGAVVVTVCTSLLVVVTGMVVISVVSSIIIKRSVGIAFVLVLF